MISSTREKVFQTKQEGEFTNDQIPGNRLISSKGSSSSTTSRQWPGFRNPRIVRVSRSSGGKDRHSKVCTIRGLRDRRIRLSVPTAIQLYDLQDRLGLGQPSKVIDWLLDNTKDDIDKLPPLQIPQGFGHQYFNHHQPMLSNFPGSQLSSFAPNLLDANSMFIKDDGGGADGGGGGMVEDDNQIIAAKRYWDNMDGVLMRAKSMEQADAAEKGKWIKVNDDRNHHQQQQNQDGNNHSLLLPAGLLNNGMAFDPNYNYHWEPPSLSLSQFGILPQTHENFLSNNTTNNTTSSTPTHVPLPISSHAPQLFFCHPPSTVPSFFPTFNPHYADDHSSRVQMNPNFQLLSSNSQHVLPNSLIKPFSLNVNAGLTQNDEDDDDDDDDADDESREDDHDEDNTDS